MSNGPQPIDSPAPLQAFEPAIDLLHDAPKEDARSGIDSAVRDDTAVEQLPPVVSTEEVPKKTLAQRWREHIETARQEGG